MHLLAADPAALHPDEGIVGRGKARTAKPNFWTEAKG